MSDLIVEIQRHIANMEKTLFDFPHIWPSEHYGSKIEYEEQLLILQRALTRLRELESGVTVSRECAGFLYAYLKQEDDIYVGSTGGYREELRIALSRQERTGESNE